MKAQILSIISGIKTIKGKDVPVQIQVDGTSCTLQKRDLTTLSSIKTKVTHLFFSWRYQSPG